MAPPSKPLPRAEEFVGVDLMSDAQRHTPLGRLVRQGCDAVAKETGLTVRVDHVLVVDSLSSGSADYHWTPRGGGVVRLQARDAARLAAWLDPDVILAPDGHDGREAAALAASSAERLSHEIRHGTGVADQGRWAKEWQLRYFEKPGEVAFGEAVTQLGTEVGRADFLFRTNLHLRDPRILTARLSIRAYPAHTALLQTLLQSSLAGQDVRSSVVEMMAEGRAGSAMIRLGHRLAGPEGDRGSILSRTTVVTSVQTAFEGFARDWALTTDGLHGAVAQKVIALRSPTAAVERAQRVLDGAAAHRGRASVARAALGA